MERGNHSLISMWTQNTLPRNRRCHTKGQRAIRFSLENIDPTHCIRKTEFLSDTNLFLKNQDLGSEYKSLNNLCFCSDNTLSVGIN